MARVCDNFVANAISFYTALSVEQWHGSDRFAYLACFYAAIAKKFVITMSELENLRFLSEELVWKVAEQFGTPSYVYDWRSLEASAQEALAFPHAFGLTVRYAMKACPNAAILKIFDAMGLHIDASSGFEVKRAILAGVGTSRICLSTQELPANFAELMEEGVLINACSLSQLERIGQECPGAEIGLRFNPGLGSGGTGKTNVGGPGSSFGIWHEKSAQVQALLEAHSLKAVRIHTHIGSGSDPEVWQRVSQMSLDLVRQFADVHTLDLGGGYKVGRMAGEQSTDLQLVGEPVKQAFEALAEETGRQIHLEIEPGTFLVANNGALVTRVQDVVDTGSEGYQFLKLDAGMTEVLRPSLYAAQHPLVVVPRQPREETAEYLVVGHCCESGDLLTPDPADAEQLLPRALTAAEVGDCCVIEGVGAYCSSMSCSNYNSFPEASEILVDKDAMLKLIRQRQTLEQMLQNEVPYAS